MHQLELIQNVKGPVFALLIDYLGERSGSIGFVLRDEFGTSDRTEKFIGAIKSEIFNDEYTDCWPGTVIVGGRARVVECRSTPSVLQAISETWDGLFDDAGTGFPEDLFMKDSNGFVILETISHEQSAVIKVARIEHIVKDMLDQRKLRLVVDKA